MEIVNAAAPTGATKPWHTLPSLDAARALHVERAAGLGAGEAASRLRELGPNRLASAAREPLRRTIARHFGDPRELVLVAAAAVSLGLGHLAAGIALLVVCVVNAALAAAVEGPGTPPKLWTGVITRVRRDGRIERIASDGLVSGDVVAVQAGDLVPADGRLLESDALTVDEAALTGERVPIAKVADAIDDPDAPLGDRKDMLYMGTRVVRGSAEFVVTTTGMATELGRIAALLGTPRRPPARPGPRPAVAVLGLATAALVAVHGHGSAAVLGAAVAYAVAALPNAAPAVVAALLDRGARPLRKTSVKRPQALEALGTATALVLDKTGTITLNEPTAVELAVPGRRYTIARDGFHHVAGTAELPLDPLLLPLALAGDEVFAALAEKGGLDIAATRAAYPRCATLPYDAAYELSAGFHRMGGGLVSCFATGRPHELLARAAFVLDPQLRRVAAGPELRRRYAEEALRLARDGSRVIALARRDFKAFDPDADLAPLVDGVTLLGLVGVADPPRPNARAAIETVRATGVGVWMITGDERLAAESVARAVGIDGQTVRGEDLAEAAHLAGVGVVVRAAPEHGVRLVELLRRSGHTVAVCGDGVNDVPALEAADVGIAIGSSASAAAKDAAAIHVTGNVSALARVLVRASHVRAGLIGYRRFQARVLAATVATIAGAAVLDIAGGMLFGVVQILYLNFTAQAFQGLALGSSNVAARRSAPVAAIVSLHVGLTLAVGAVVEHMAGTDTARTAAVATFAALNVLYSLSLRPGGRRIWWATLASVVAVLVGVESGLL